jgi:hypothetical protein
MSGLFFISYTSISPTTEKLVDEVPGEQLPPIIARLHISGLFKNMFQVFIGVLPVSLGRLNKRI